MKYLFQICFARPRGDKQLMFVIRIKGNSWKDSDNKYVIRHINI